MDASKVNYYEPCDRAIQSMNRENLDAFGRMKITRWDRVNVIQTVMAVYRQSVKRARKHYYEVAIEAYILGAEMCGMDTKKAHRMASKSITLEWVDKVLDQTDFVTLYRFMSEADRKAYKLAETLEVSRDKDFEINKALRYWSQQLGQYAINMTDYAIVKAFADCGVPFVQWVSEKDSKVCNECYSYNGQIFRINEIPAKPHWGCRCRIVPVFRIEEETPGPGTAT